VSGLVGLDGFSRPRVAALLLAVMAVWTVVVTLLLERPERRTRLLLAVDLALAAGVLLGGLLAQARGDIDGGQPTLTLTWGAVPVMAWAVRSGAWGGLLAGAVMSAATLAWRQDLTRATVGSVVLLLLTGAVVGYVVSLSREAERAYADAVQEQARTAERDRLSRQVHDGVLQALALVAKTSADPALAALAREQERALRGLVSTAPEPAAGGELDLRALLVVGPAVEVAQPGTPVLLPAGVARELAAAVRACLDNVDQHAGGRAWVLVEDERDAVTVSVRDEGPGIAPGRLEQAASEGRLGVSGSVRGRVQDLGGTVVVTSAPGQGTEVELRVPR